MDVGNYSLKILDSGNMPRHAGARVGYIPMQHGEYFKICMHNRSNRQTLAEVQVNGQDCGTFVLGRYDTATIERPAEREYKFQFYRVGTQEASQAELWTGDAANGLVQVVFKPEKVVVRASFEKCSTLRGGGAQSLRGATKGLSAMDSMPTMAASSGYDEGGIGLGEHSDQHFNQVSGFETDPNGTVTISLRLVARKDDRPKPIRGPVANPVPPPIR